MTGGDTTYPDSTEPVPTQPLARRIVAGLRVFLEPRVLVILFLGFTSGLPLALSGSTLAIRMTDVGVDLGTIGLFSLAGLPYTIKFLWAPLVDAIRIPVLSRLLGRRRGWLVFSQMLLMAAIVHLGILDPVADRLLFILGVGLVLFYLVCGLGAAANVGIAELLVRDGVLNWGLAGAAGALLTVVWNYAVSSTLVWRPR